MNTTQILDKGSGRINEDVLLAQGNLFGVFDGATSLVENGLGPGETGGLMAATLAEKAFSANDAPLEVLARKANDRIRGEMAARGCDGGPREALWSTSAAVVRILPGRFEWLQAGDCRILAVYGDGTCKNVSEPVDHDLETLLMWRDLAGRTKATIFEACREKIIEVRRLMNEAYSVLNGEEKAPALFKAGVEDLEGVTDLLLFTDGLTLPSRDPRARNQTGRLASIYLKEGLAGLKERIRLLEAEDPDCRLYPRFKTHDDIAAIAIRF